MSQLAAVVMCVVLLNTSLPFVNSLGLGNVQFAYSDNINLTAIQSVGGCTAGGTSCGVNLGGGGALSTLITFGDFLWAAANFLIQIPIAIALPAYLMVQDFYAPISFAAIYNIAFWVLFAFWINDYVAGRYKMEIP